jgi:membrane protease YdiL (CAAX protease family)
MKTVQAIKQHHLVTFFLLTLVITWPLWIPATAIKLNGGAATLGPDSPVGQLARWSPGIAAMVLVWIFAGKQGLRTLFQPVGIWRVHIGWYAMALLLSPAIFYAARFVDLVLGNSYQILFPLASITAPLVFVIPVAVISAFPGAFAEELGWRGFALPRLQSNTGMLTSSFVLALVWGIWHIPSLLYFGETQAFDIAFAVLNFIPITILYTWLYNHTRGSLLLVTLFHVSQQCSNYFLGLIPAATDKVLMWIAAIAVVALTLIQLKQGVPVWRAHRPT